MQLKCNKSRMPLIKKTRRHSAFMIILHLEVVVIIVTVDNT